MSGKPVVVSFKLFPGKDDDLIAFLQSIGHREKSAYIRLAIRTQFVSKVDSNMACISPASDMAVPQEEVSIARTKNLSDDDLMERLSRW